MQKKDGSEGRRASIPKSACRMICWWCFFCSFDSTIFLCVPPFFSVSSSSSSLFFFFFSGSSNLFGVDFFLGSSVRERHSKCKVRKRTISTDHSSRKEKERRQTERQTDRRGTETKPSRQRKQEWARRRWMACRSLAEHLRCSLLLSSV
jgi:hypothetical protein